MEKCIRFFFVLFFNNFALLAGIGSQPCRQHRHMPVYSLQANLQDKAERLRLALLYSDIPKKKLFTVVTVAQELPSLPPWLTVSIPQFELISQPRFTFSLCGNGVLCTLSYSSFASSIQQTGTNSALPLSDNVHVNVKGNSGTSHKQLQTSLIIGSMQLGKTKDHCFLTRNPF